MASAMMSGRRTAKHLVVVADPVTVNSPSHGGSLPGRRSVVPKTPGTGHATLDPEDALYLLDAPCRRRTGVTTNIAR